MGRACLTLSLGWRSMWSFLACGARRHARNSSASTLPDSVLSCRESLASRSLRSHAGQKESNQIATLCPWPSSKGVNRLHLPAVHTCADWLGPVQLTAFFVVAPCDFLPLTACSLPLPSLSGSRPGPSRILGKGEGKPRESWESSPRGVGPCPWLQRACAAPSCRPWVWGLGGQGKRRKAFLPGRPSRPGSLPRQGPCARLFPRAPKIACEALH